ncbi:MAG TPA: hypothetical protein VH351_21650 [Bryobacteraceae bacterium]|jgi:hypothetical protein|nr:hypothetical protein [Bryobacteraceae bacterium]
MRILPLLLSIAALTTVPATPSTLWNWDYSGDAINASGTFTTVDSPDPNGGYLITAITGTRNGETITALQPTGTPIPGNEPYDVDNLVFLGPGPQLTKNGFGFAIADGTFSNPFYADFLPMPEYLEFFSTPPFNGSPSPGDSELPVEFSAQPIITPEPGTSALVLAIFLVGAMGLRTDYRPFATKVARARIVAESDCMESK